MGRKLKVIGKTKTFNRERRTSCLGYRPHYLLIMWLEEDLAVSQSTSFLNCKNVPLYRVLWGPMKICIWMWWSQSLAACGNLMGSLPGLSPSPPCRTELWWACCQWPTLDRPPCGTRLWQQLLPTWEKSWLAIGRGVGFSLSPGHKWPPFRGMSGGLPFVV